MAGPVISPPAGSAPAPAADNATASAPSDAAAAEPASGSNYVVKKGDSLARIARQHHVKVAALRSANGLKSDFLHIGQKLSIPAASVASTASASAPKEKEEGLAKLRQPNTTLLGDSIPNEKPASAHEKIVATGGRHTYTVAKGDTLTRIAHRFHTTSSAIMAMNNITDARKLRLGQKLRIPSQESRSAATSAPEPVAPRAQPVDHIEPRATPTAQLANFVP
jgi:LysM repeat protein